MKTIVVVYSRSKNNLLLAQEIQVRLQCNLHVITEVKPRSGFSVLLEPLLPTKTELVKADISLTPYEQVIFVAPVWWKKVASPMRVFMEQHKEEVKRYGFITMCNGVVGQREMLEAELTTLLGREPVAVTELWVGSLVFRAIRQDMALFTEEISAFLEAMETEQT